MRSAHNLFQKKDGVTLPEVLIASTIALYVLASAWAVFSMAWGWWAETYPWIEAEQVARIALARIVEGTVDTTAGTDTIGTYTDTRRNGIAYAVLEPSVATPGRIDFALEKERESGVTTNVRRYYIGTDTADATKKVLYYRNNASADFKVPETKGISDLQFAKTGGGIDPVRIDVTATVTKTVSGTRAGGYTINVQYSESVYLRSYVP